MFKISKRFKFEASHQLMGLPEGHQCGRLHGHSYEVEVVIGGYNNSLTNGWLRDFGELKPVKDYIDTMLDHQHLNEVFPFQTTSELLAKYLFGLSCKLLNLSGKPPAHRLSNELWLDGVLVSETKSTWALYTEVDG